MARVRTVSTRVQSVGSRIPKAQSLSDQRMTGRKLQSRRFEMWQKNPQCAQCGRVVDYPNGFELDHVVALTHGGADTEANCQLLCVHYESDGSKAGCHEMKTRRDLGGILTR